MAAVARGGRIVLQPGFVLHAYPHRETSLIVEAFTRDHGRVALVAKGARRPHSVLRAVLQRFQPLALSWSGRSEVRTLSSAEWIGGIVPPEKDALLCGFYLNELLLKLLAREDPHPALFNEYLAALGRLAHESDRAAVLRGFEAALLRELGLGLTFGRCAATGLPIVPQDLYVVEPERGPRPAYHGDCLPKIVGQTLLDIERGEYSDRTTRAQSKTLFRALLAHHLGHATLNTRQILMDFVQ